MDCGSKTEMTPTPKQRVKIDYHVKYVARSPRFPALHLHLYIFHFILY